MIIEIEDIKAISINSMYCTDFRNKRRYLSKEGKAYKDRLDYEFMNVDWGEIS